MPFAAIAQPEDDIGPLGEAAWVGHRTSTLPHIILCYDTIYPQYIVKAKHIFGSILGELLLKGSISAPRNEGPYDERLP